MLKQKEIFRSGEGDAWFMRNHTVLQKRTFFTDDSVVHALRSCLKNSENFQKRVLEVGCGDGKRLDCLAKSIGLNCFGIEPSAKAGEAARQKGLQVI